MSSLVIGKRFYTNKDTLEERFGRIFNLPFEWTRAGRDTSLWLVDYHGKAARQERVGALPVHSTPVFSLSALRRLASCIASRPRVVVATGDCYIGLLGWLVARVSGASFVFDVYDKYDEFAGYVRPLGWDLFGFLRRRADAIFYSSAPLGALLEGGGSGSAWTVVPNGVDADAFRPRPRDACRQSLGLAPGDILVGYFGGMEADRGVQDLVMAIGRLRDAGLEARLLVCGKRNAATSLEHDWIDYRGMVPHADMPMYLNAMDVLAIPYRLSPFMDMGASCKIAEYLMCERPVASTRTPNFTGNFPRQAAQLGTAMCEPENVVDLARVIRSQLERPIVASAPTEFTWPGIAARALAAIDAASRIH